MNNLFAKYDEKMTGMTDTLATKDCIYVNKDVSSEERKECMWLTNYADKKTLDENGGIRQLPVVAAQCVKAAGLGVTKRSNSAEIDNSVEKRIERTNCKQLE